MLAKESSFKCLDACCVPTWAASLIYVCAAWLHSDTLRMVLTEHKKHIAETEPKSKAKPKSAGRKGKRPSESGPADDEDAPDQKGARKSKRPRGSKK